MFSWATDIPGVEGWDRDQLAVREEIPEEGLRELLALFHRYKIPMVQLQQFESAQNKGWLRNPNSYWHREMYEKEN